MATLGRDIEDLRQGLLSRMPKYGLFDGLAASITVGFLNLLAPEQPRSNRSQKRYEQTRRRATISSRITSG